MVRIYYFIISILFTIFTNCVNPDNRNIDEIYNECYSESVIVNEKPIKFYIKEYENILIKNKILKDSTSKSYFDLFKKMKNYDYFDFKYKYAFLDSTKGIKVTNISLCPLKIRLHPEYDNYSLSKIFNKMYDENGRLMDNIKPNEIFSEFDVNSFKNDFFKHKFLNIIKDIDGKKIKRRTIIFYDKEEYPNYVNLSLTERNEILWNNKIIKDHNFTNKLSDYYTKYKDESLFIIDYKNDVYPKINLYLNDFEKELKNNQSFIIYNKSYTELSSLNKQYIDYKHSLNINIRFFNNFNEE